MIKLAVCILAILLCPLLMRAQLANNTSLVGTVIDSTGGVVAGAHVTAVNEDTKVQYDGVTNAEGFYSITGQINPGNYDVTVDMTGFQKSKKTGIVVVINESARTDFALKVGSSTTEITVSAETPAIQTDDALLGETVPETQVHDLPMNGRNALDLANVASNVNISTGPALTGVPPGKTASGAGSRGVNNSITLDGISIMNNLGSTVTVTPNPDSLDSVQTTNGNYTAQYGNYLGVHINESTKYGTNDFHGTTYNYLQNDALNSQGFNHSYPIPAKAELRYNLFGDVVSGPVILPHLYNGRNKTFFVASYEGLRTHTSTPTYTQAFTHAEESGDFSALLNTSMSGAPKPTVLFSPIDGHAYFNSSTGTQVVNDQPAANAPIVSNILAYAATSNVPNAPLVANNLFALTTRTNENSSVDRIDETIGDKIRIFGRLDWQDVTAESVAREYVNNNYNPTYARNGAAGFTYVISPTLVNDLRGGFNWLKTESLDYFYGNGSTNADAQLALPAPFGVGKAYGDPGLPDVTGPTSFSISETGDNWIQDDRTYQVYDQLSWTRNKHSIMVGIDIRRLNIGRAAVNAARGVLNFAQSYTSYQSLSNLPVTAAFAALCPGGTIAGGVYTAAPTSCTYGSADASLFTGVMSGDTTPLDQVKEEITQWRDGFFVQDAWQLTKDLTLEYGIRYELPYVPVSANGYARLMDPTYSSLTPVSSATSPTTYTPRPGLALTAPNHKDIGPHVGLAYRLTNKITVRGGGGIYYNSNQLNAYTLTSSNFPFASSVVYSSPVNGAQSSSNPYDQLSNPTAGASAFPIAGVAGTYVSAYSVANPLPSERMYQWNMDTGLELWRNAGLEVQYLGSHSIHLNTNLYPNQPAATGAVATSSVNARRPNQNFGQIRAAANIASAAYQGVTTVLRQRLSHGLSGSFSYTYAHALDESNDANNTGTCMIQGDCLADWGTSGYDIRHRAVLTFSYGVPPLRNKNYFVRAATGGWHLNGMVTVQSGTPINVSFGSFDWADVGVPQTAAGGGPQRPQWVHAPRYNCNKGMLFSEGYNANSASCVDETAYAAPARFTYGNIHRNDLYGPGSWTNNLSLYKQFEIREGINFELRVEAFNAFNHGNLTTPGNITLTATPQSTVSANPGYTVGTLSAGSSSSAFGYPAIQTSNPRTVQIAGKINF